MISIRNLPLCCCNCHRIGAEAVTLPPGHQRRGNIAPLVHAAMGRSLMPVINIEGAVGKVQQCPYFFAAFNECKK
jgi:hypothetical protein